MEERASARFGVARSPSDDDRNRLLSNFLSKGLGSARRCCAVHSTSSFQLFRSDVLPAGCQTVGRWASLKISTRLPASPRSSSAAYLFFALRSSLALAAKAVFRAPLSSAHDGKGKARKKKDSPGKRAASRGNSQASGCLVSTKTRGTGRAKETKSDCQGPTLPALPWALGSLHTITSSDKGYYQQRMQRGSAKSGRTISVRFHKFLTFLKSPSRRLVDRAKTFSSTLQPTSRPACALRGLGGVAFCLASSIDALRTAPNLFLLRIKSRVAQSLELPCVC